MKRFHSWWQGLFSTTSSSRRRPAAQPRAAESESLEVRTLLTSLLDPSWNGTGIEVYRQSPIGDATADATLDPDGKVLLFGNVNESLDPVIKAVRFHPDGSLDTTFNGTGTATLDLGFVGVNRIHTHGTSGAVYQSGPNRGKVLVAGTRNIVGDSDFLVARFNVDGTLDTSFGGVGYVTASWSTWDQATSIEIYESGPNAGKCIVVGTHDNGRLAEALVARFNADGSLDSTFDSDGQLNFRISYTDTASAVAPTDLTGASRVLIDLPSDKILIAGFTGMPDTYSASYASREYGGMVARLNNNGSFDTTFGASGVAFVPFNPGDRTAGQLNDMAVQPDDGKIVVVASTYRGYGQFYTARLTENGSFDMSFNGTGYISEGASTGAKTVVVTPDHKIYVGGNSANDFFLLRYNANGSPDTTFNPALNPTLSTHVIQTDIGGFDGVAEGLIANNGNLLLAGRNIDLSQAPRTSSFATVQYLLQRDDLSVTIEQQSATTVPGGVQVTSIIRVKNIGDAAIVPVLTDVLPVGMTFVSFTPPTPDWMISAPAPGTNGTIIATRSALTQADGEQVFTLTKIVDVAAFSTADIANTVTVSSNTLDYNVLNNSATENFTPDCVPVPTGLVNWWKAEGDATDFIDGTNGVLNGTSFVTGEVDQAFNFDGGHYISVPSASDLDFTTAMTIEGWVYLTTNNTNSGLVFKGSFGGSQGIYSLGFFTGYSNRLTLRLNGSASEGAGQVTGSTSLTPGQWYHIAAVYDGASEKLYVNGVLDGSQAYSGAIATDTSPLIIGGYYAPPYLFNGRLDELSMYDRALSHAELFSVFSARGGGKCVNDPPSVSNEGNVTVGEGATAMNTGSWSDPNQDDDVTLTATSGTIIKNANGTWSWSFNTADGPDDSRTVTITATDDHGESSQTSFNLIANNLAPSVANAGNVSASEGATVTNTGTWSDPGVDVVTLAASIGSVTKNADGSWSWSFNTVDGPDDSQSVTITATDSDGAATSTSFNLTVNNVGPSVANNGNVTVSEGTTATNTGTWSDPGVDVVTLAASIGSVTKYADGTWWWSFNTADGPDQTQNVTITATDSDGASSSTTFTLLVSNLAPSLAISGASSVNEGSTAANSGTWSDPGADVVTLAASVGSVTQNADGTWSWSFNTADGPDDSQVVTITATDSDGAATTTSFHLTVSNVAPSVANAGNVTVNEGATASNTGTWSDPGVDVVTLAASVGSVTKNADGTWSWSFDTADGPDDSQTLTITATDSDGANTTTTFDLTVNNIAPSVANDGNVTVNEGATASNTGTWFDPGVDVVTLAASVGSVTKNADGTWSWSFNTSDGPDDSQTVTITATDSDGANTSTTFGLTVNNVTPSAANNGNVTANEGATATNSGTWSDPGVDVVTLVASIGSVTKNPDGTWSWSFNTADGPGESQVVTITATDSDGASTSTTFNLTVSNVAPSVTHGGNVAVNEGTTASNSGAWSDPGADVVTLTASVGSVTKNANGTWSWSLNTADGPDQTQDVTITATDSDGANSSTTFPLLVSNVAPSLAISGASSVNEGATYSLGLSSSDPGADTITHWIINWGDNVTQVVSGNPASVTHVYAVGGTNYTISATATDEDGTFNANNLAVTVHRTNSPPPASIGSGCHGPALIITGTDLGEIIRVVPRGKKDVKVLINGQNRGTFSLASFDEIIIHGNGGDDDIEIVAALTQEAFLFGEAGNDRLKGGNGPNVLVGGDNDDDLIGSQGRDVIIGGRGADRLVGNQGDDLLIAGFTNHDTDLIALCAILDEWSRTDLNYTQRFNHLRLGGGLNGSYLLNDLTSHDDGAVDRLTGSSDRDLFFANLDMGVLDKITDLKCNELSRDID